MKTFVAGMWIFLFACLLGLSQASLKRNAHGDIINNVPRIAVTFNSIPNDVKNVILEMVGPQVNLRLVSREFDQSFKELRKSFIIRVLPGLRDTVCVTDSNVGLLWNTLFASNAKSFTIRRIFEKAPYHDHHTALETLIDRFARHLVYESEVRKDAIDVMMRLDLPRGLLKPLLRHYKDEYGKQLFDYAVSIGYIPLIKLFLDLNVQNVNAKSPTGGTLLHVAPRLHNGLEIAHFALSRRTQDDEREIRINSYDHQYGNTALHSAVLAGNVELVKLYCESGANVNAVNEDYERPLHMAGMLDFPVREEITYILRNFGAIN